MPERRVPPPGGSATGRAPALPEGDAAEGRGGKGQPPALPCPALPCPAALPGLPRRRRRLQGRARVRPRREGDAGGAEPRGGEGEAARGRSALLPWRAGRGGTAAVRNHTPPPRSPPSPPRRLPLIALRSPVRPGCFPAVTWLLPPPPKGFGSRFTFTLAPPRGSRGPRRLDRSPRSERPSRCPAPCPAPEGAEGQSGAHPPTHL